MGQGYHAANLVQQENDKDLLLAESLNHLAHAPTTDNQTIAQLVKSNAILTTSIQTLSKRLEQAVNIIAVLSGAANNHFPTTKHKTNAQPKYDLQMDPVGYCWTHGYEVKLGHNTATCISTINIQHI